MTTTLALQTKTCGCGTVVVLLRHEGTGGRAWVSREPDVFAGSAAVDLARGVWWNVRGMLAAGERRHRVHLSGCGRRR